MSKSESICRYAYTIFIQLRVRQLGSLYVAIHTSSDWKRRGDSKEWRRWRGVFQTMCGWWGLSSRLSRHNDVNCSLVNLKYFWNNSTYNCILFTLRSWYAVACPAVGVAGVRPLPRSAAPIKMHMCIAITRQSARPAQGVASLLYHKGCLSPVKSLVITNNKTSPPLLG